MTCDKLNGNLDYLSNNNNVTNGAIPKDDHKSNRVKMNGKAEFPLLEEEVETRKSLIVLLIIFSASIIAMFYIYKNFPELEE